MIKLLVNRSKVSLSGFYIARWPVTVDQFRAFLDATGHEPGDRRCREGIGNHPVVYVTWHDARRYCEWLGDRLREYAYQRLDATGTDEAHSELWQALADRTLRAGLPSEAEWERAARHTDGRFYPWGNSVDPERANYGDTGIGATSSVGCFAAGASVAECEDMSGNVWEWTRSLYGDYPYPDDPEGRGLREDPRASGRRVLRGGAFFYYGNRVRCAYRFNDDPDFRNFGVGFRVVLSPFL